MTKPARSFHSRPVNNPGLPPRGICFMLFRK